MSAPADMLADGPARQAEYAAWRRAWRAGLVTWMRGGRLKFIRVRMARPEEAT
jgi:hypothetical protein